MNLYTLYPYSAHEEFSLEIKGNNIEIIEDYFKFDLNKNFLEKPRINLTFENSFSYKIESILSHDDFYYSSSGVLLFSERFYLASAEYLKNEGAFYPCLVNNNSSEIYAFYIKNRKDIFNLLQEEVENVNFNIFRDIEKTYIYAVSEQFVRFIKDKKLNIKFLKFTENYIKSIF